MSSFLEKVKSFFTLSVIPEVKKLWAPRNNKIGIVVGVLLVIFILYKIFSPAPIDASIETVTEQTLHSTVLASGQVTSQTDLSLSFTGNGIVKSVRAVVGDNVLKGQILANLDQGSALATYTSAQGGLKAAQARYQKLVEGASSEEITLARVALTSAQADLENTKKQQGTLVSNAYRAMLNSGLEVTSAEGSSNSGATPIVTGTYIGTTEGEYRITTYGAGSGGYFSATGLSSSNGPISSTSSTALGAEGLYLQFPSNFLNTGSTVWVVAVPNKKSTTYVTNLNAYQSALETQVSAVASAQALVNQRQAELDVTLAKARTVELDLAEADVLSAQGTMQSAQAILENTILRAPANGTITRVDTKIGELATATKEVMVLQDVGTLYVEATINEANIASLKIDQPATMTLDAFGPEKTFSGKIIHIDPSATISDGIVNYKIQISLDTNTEVIRPGMNANIRINTGDREQVIAVPKAAITVKEGVSTVTLLTDEKKNKTIERIVTTGFVGDGNLIEIQSGLSVGDKILIGVKQ